MIVDAALNPASSAVQDQSTVLPQKKTALVWKNIKFESWEVGVGENECYFRTIFRPQG